ncbi:MAG: hypothetical protein A3H32_07335 [Betaproteobacteria bacterium RIFCSPLOWO2_02_FULL_63_19]|nr:MAG: hypothetical protein A3H32_07335 [Betaproteobacteria bacterium RIFCSPLOWO2_02_FULL_63_19]
MGSLYYVMYAIQRGLSEKPAPDLIQLTLIAVSLSILVHGTSVKPLLVSSQPSADDIIAAAALPQCKTAPKDRLDCWPPRAATLAVRHAR